MSVVFLGVGSNLGDRRRSIRKALSLLRSSPHVSVKKVSSFRETLPVGGPPQGKFLNGAVKIETSLSPRELLRFLKAVERRVGRRPSKAKWGPRVIDLDILLFGNRVVSEPGLRIPHARLAERAFALQPLAELSPSARHPLLKKTIGSIVREYEGHQEFQKTGGTYPQR